MKFKYLFIAVSLGATFNARTNDINTKQAAVMAACAAIWAYDLGSAEGEGLENRVALGVGLAEGAFVSTLCKEGDIARAALWPFLTLLFKKWYAIFKKPHDESIHPALIKRLSFYELVGALISIGGSAAISS